jgi:hypothetical protein
MIGSEHRNAVERFLAPQCVLLKQMRPSLIFAFCLYFFGGFVGRISTRLASVRAGSVRI